MNKILIPVICGLALVGCRSTGVTPDESWRDYCRYYSAEPVRAKTGTNVVATVAAPTGTNVVTAVDVHKVNSRDDQKVIDGMKAQGYVVIGKFLIKDGTDIGDAAVRALAQKLGAKAVVWSTANGAGWEGLPNPADVDIIGTDMVKSARMEGNVPSEPYADQVLVHQHEIWMLK